MSAPSKETQIAEGENRSIISQNSPVTQPTADELGAVNAVHDDPTRGDLPDARQTDAPQERSAEPEKQFDIRAAKRNEIISRFRTNRAEEKAEGDDDFARSGAPEGFDHPVPDLAPAEEVVTQEAPVVPAPQQPEAQPDPAPQKRKVKVRGQEFEITEEEYHAAAQKALAGDSYLDEAKARLNQADELFRDLQNRAAHPAQPSAHPAGQEAVQPGQQPEQAADPQHPEENPLDKAIELIQYGDPAEASQLLNQAVERKAAQIAEQVVRNTLQTQKVEDQAAKAQRELKEFEDQHQDLAKDPIARAAIEATVFAHQTEDLKALGINLAKLRQDGRAPTPADIAEAHLICRTRGLNVRSPGEILKSAAEDFTAWRGKATGTEPAPADPNPNPQPTRQVEVQVDRTQRRATIPQQPSRSAAPQRQMIETPPQPRDRSSIVESIKAQRAKPRGKVLGA